MRFFTNHSAAASAQKNIPFAGLGFDMCTVQAAAQLMVPAHPRCHCDSTESILPAPGVVMQPSGYELLVSLGREIRGR